VIDMAIKIHEEQKKPPTLLCRRQREYKKVVQGLNKPFQVTSASIENNNKQTNRKITSKRNDSIQA
jgi:hypothetical protein